MTHIAPSQAEARTGIVVVLRDHPAEANHAVAEPCHAGPPERETEATAAVRRRNDVKTEKGESVLVGDHRYARDHPTIDETTDEATLVGLAEASAIIESGVPAFLRCPVECQVHLGRGHRPNLQRIRHATSITPRPRLWQIDTRPGAAADPSILELGTERAGRVIVRRADNAGDPVLPSQFRQRHPLGTMHLRHAV